MEGAEKMGTLLTKFRHRTTLKKSKVNKILLTIFMILFAILMIIPFILMISASFKHSAVAFANIFEVIPKNIYLGNYEALLKDPLYFKWFLNSVFVVILTIALKIVVVSMAAYAFARLRFKHRDLLFVIIIRNYYVCDDDIPRYNNCSKIFAL
ncbi:hypothetical protein [Clostridium estertheticum]|uniref:hypothetical protein n=1 Tax=Clostridium estertheticum TaxID=238834 RepID=UPI001CF56A24|nr:hypothetical protein [Clostridium estertheticum]MCB2358776.1 hypothetical protein [Clostridium estertheticum]